MPSRDDHLYGVETYEALRLRVRAEATPEPGADLTLPTDRQDDFDPAPAHSSPSRARVRQSRPVAQVRRDTPNQPAAGVSLTGSGRPTSKAA